MSNTYLARLYHDNKKLFFFIVSFGSLTLFFNLFGLEATPFFVWGMYSQKMKPAVNYEATRVTVNDSIWVDIYAGYPDNTRAFLLGPLSYYRQMKEQGTDPVIPFLRQKLGNRYALANRFGKNIFNVYNPEDFRNWYGCFLEKTTGIKIHSVRIDILKTHFDKEQHPVPDSVYLFESWKQP